MLASLSFLLSLKQETLLIPRMFTVYTFMMDNEKMPDSNGIIADFKLVGDEAEVKEV